MLLTIFISPQSSKGMYRVHSRKSLWTEIKFCAQDHHELCGEYLSVMVRYSLLVS